MRPELYKVQKVQKKFNWTDFQLKFKVPFFPLVHEGEGGELWTWVESQFIWTSSELFELNTTLLLVDMIPFWLFEVVNVCWVSSQSSMPEMVWWLSPGCRHLWVTGLSSCQGFPAGTWKQRLLAGRRLPSKSLEPAYKRFLIFKLNHNSLARLN